jgi:hypothetical protein
MECQTQLIVPLEVDEVGGVVEADSRCTMVAGRRGVVELTSWIYEIVEKSAAVIRSVRSAAAVVQEASSGDRIGSMEVVPRRGQSLRLRLGRTEGSAGADDFPLYLGVVLEQDFPRKKRS